MVRLTTSSTSTGGKACGRVDAPGVGGSAGSVGSAYLVQPTLAVTCAHVVQHVVEAAEDRKVTEMVPGVTITVTFGDQVIPAAVEKLDTKADVAILRLATAPLGHAPLALADPTRGPCSLLSYATGSAPAHGVLINTEVHNKYGDPRMTLRAAELAERMVVKDQDHSGTPILSGETVVGHIIGAIRDPNDADYCFAGLAEAVSSKEVLDLLGPLSRPQPGRAADDDLPGFVPPLPGFVPPTDSTGDTLSPTAPKIGRKEHHAFVSFRALERNRMNDGVWAHGLVDRLGTLGYKCFPAPHILFGDVGFGPAYAKALGRSRVGLVVYSERWREGPPFKAHLKALLKRAKKDPESFRIIVVRLDDSPLPDDLSGFTTIEVGSRGISVGKQRMPDAHTVREVSAAIQDADGAESRGSRPDHTTPVGAKTRAEDEEVRRSPSERSFVKGNIGGRLREEMGPGGTDQDPAAAAGSAADGVLGKLAEARRQPKKVRAFAMGWLNAGMPGSDVPVEAARLLIGAQAHDAALEVLDKARKLEEAKPEPSSRDLARIRRMRGAALGEAERFEEAIAELGKLEADGQLDQWSGGILGSAYKKRWLKLGKRRRALLQRSFEVYRDTYARTLHYYPGINAATLAMLLGRKDEGREIAAAIRTDLEANDDLYYWDEASLGEAYLLLGEWDKAVEAYTHAAVMVMGNLKDMSRMRSQIPLILSEKRRAKDPQVARVWDTLVGPTGLFQAGGVAVFAGHGLELLGGAGSLVEERERLLRRRIKDTLTEHDVAIGFCSAVAGSDILFAEAVLERSGDLHISLPYNQAAFREDIPAGVWRDRFDRIVANESVQVVELRGDEPREPDDRAVALRECGDDVLDRAIQYGRGLDLAPVMVVVWDGSDGRSPEARALQAGSDEGLTTAVINSGADTGSTGAREIQPTGDSGSQSGGLSQPGAGSDVGARGVKMAVTSAAPAPLGSYRKKHLLIVGIDKYMNWRPLENARHDAEGIKEALIRDYGFELSGELFDRSATASTIEKAFQLGLCKGEQGSEGEEARWGLSGRAEADDLVVFFFAGHGHTERRPNDEEVGFLVPVEAPIEGKAGMLRISRIRDWTEDLASKHVLYIFDSCFSGDATTGAGGKGKAGYSRQVITAGAPDQVVADGGEQFKNHGLFTGRLLYGLSSEETRLERPLYASELAGYLVRHVPEDARALNAGFVQTPSAGVLPGHGGAHIVLKQTDVDAPADEDPNDPASKGDEDD